MVQIHVIPNILLLFGELFDLIRAVTLVIAPFHTGWNELEIVKLNELKSLATITLEKITATEMTWGRGGDPVDMGHWQGPDPLEISPLNTEVQRTLAAIWRIRVADPSEPLDIQARVIGENGRPNLISHVQYPTEEIHVDIFSLAPEIIESDDNSFLLEGGLSMILHLGDVRFSGTYAGTVVLTINNL